jgi:hypothetical protein
MLCKASGRVGIVTQEQLTEQARRMLECVRNLDEEGRRVAVQAGFVQARFFQTEKADKPQH